MRKIIISILIMLVVFTNESINATSLSVCGVNNVETAQIIDCTNARNIDYNILARATNLKKLTLKNTNLKNVPPQIYQLTNLEYLNLGKNNIKTISNDLRRLDNLKTLILDNNSLEIFPEAITNLRQLRHLDLSYNSIYYIPNSFNSLVNIETVNLSDNSINSIPTITFLSKLESLNLNNNLLFSLPNLTQSNISELNLENNILTVGFVITSKGTFMISNQNKIRVIDNQYTMNNIFYNQKNMIIQGSELNNTKKIVGFKDYNFINLRDDNDNRVRLADYVNSTNRIIESGKISANIEFINNQGDRFVTNERVSINFLTNYSKEEDKVINIEEDDDTDKGSSGNNTITPIIETPNINKTIKESDNNSVNDKLYYMMKANLNDVESNHAQLYQNAFILSIITCLMFLLPLILIAYLTRKIRALIGSIEEI